MNFENKVPDDTSRNLVDLSQVATAQDNSSFLFCTDDASRLHTEHNKIKRSISKCQAQTSSDTSIEKSDDSSEVLSKRQKLNESVCNTSAESDNTVPFKKSTLIVEQQNYHLINESVKNESSNSNLEMGSATANNFQSNPCRHKDNSNKWEATKEDEREEQKEDENNRKDENNKKVADYLKLKKKFPTWHIVPEVINRQIGSNPLFERRFYSSLYAVERFQLMYKFYLPVTHDKTIDILNFNHKGNLLMCVVYDEISIWDWAIGKKSFIFSINDDICVLYAKWLPLDNYVAFSGEDSSVCLLEIENNILTKLATHDGRSYKLAVHPEIPHVILSAGTDSKVLSIDIRESNPTELLEVKENSLNVLLHSIDFNPSNSNEFCVAGQSYCVMAYDRRKVSEPLYKLWPYDVENGENEFVTSATYNYNGTEILVSYDRKGSFLFNRLITSSRGNYGHIYQNVFNGIFFGPKSEYIVAGYVNKIFILEKNSKSVIQCMTGDRDYISCLESHPHIPILAACGDDDSVKLWVPSEGKLSVLRSFGKHFRAYPLHYKSNSSLGENDTNDIHFDDDDRNFRNSGSNTLSNNLSESDDIE
ncbi:PREDICTED: LOW QUALITY PROTEIN: DDB1- and CUL4-associated factor 8-like [Trachymyrmex septentrionalis]|uniref:LOW QUALITY PROTEIN: DDB1- and CUL4-associated factor 8-like n=1 Tax=Trachymyrmex septentrionalis TaxID=34720 RepID=UPI00084F1569|nr:PREDICTED: LOW QUALITY PROTEIN: DDB1- and CUL4-associated factor 8-like [Trachymyrmex septentrionalis]